MKKLLLSITFVFSAAAFTIVFGQAAPAGAGTPAGGGDKNLADDGIKMRSVEMERIKKEAQFAEAAKVAPINKDISARFPEIKEDFEGIQLLDDAIIKAYTTGKSIDYGVIATSADEINEKAKRLDSNLFAPLANSEDDKLLDSGSKAKVEKIKTVRDLIVELDTTIGSFVTSKIFGNIKVIDPETAIKTRTELHHILRLSEKLSIEAKKSK